MGAQEVNDSLTSDRGLKQEIGLDERQKKKTCTGKEKGKEEGMETPGKSKILPECRRYVTCLFQSGGESAMR
jgi:hypothetical protein